MSVYFGPLTRLTGKGTGETPDGQPSRRRQTENDAGEHTEEVEKQHDVNESDFRCAICHRDTMVFPYMLRCGHNFCRGCLERAIGNNRSVNCPECRAPSSRAEIIFNRALESVFAAVRFDSEYVLEDRREVTCAPTFVQPQAPAAAPAPASVPTAAAEEARAAADNQRDMRVSFTIACMNRDLEEVNRLIAAGVDIHDAGDRALMWAVQNQTLPNNDVVNLLLATDPVYRNWNQRVLRRAEENGYGAAVALLRNNRLQPARNAAGPT